MTIILEQLILLFTFMLCGYIFGKCRLVENREETLSMVKTFALKYYPNEAMINEEIALSGMGVQMFAIEIEHMSGKEVQER